MPRRRRGPPQRGGRRCLGLVLGRGRPRRAHQLRWGLVDGCLTVAVADLDDVDDDDREDKEE
jgi:hypothetical protein